jgi:uncharacterized protein YraI
MLNQKKIIVLSALLLVSILLGILTVSAQDEITGMVIDAINVRSGPGTDHAVITNFTRGINVVIEARDTRGRWILVHSEDGAVRGWVASRYVVFGGDEVLGILPVTAELLNAPGPAGGGASPIPEGDPNAATIATLNVRSGPGTGNTKIGELAYQQRVVVEARNDGADWIVVHSANGTIRGWVAARYVDFDAGLSLNDLAVSGESFGVPQQDAAIGMTSPDIPPMSIASLQSQLVRLQNTPVLHNMTSGSVYNIRNRGRGLGNNSHVFMKVGDSLSSVQQWLVGFGTGNYNLGGYGNLQTTINWFSTPLPNGASNSFVSPSYASHSGYVAHSVLESTWVPPEVCGGDIALICEYKVNKPSVAIILFGAVDMWVSNPYSNDAADANPEGFRETMFTIVDNLVNMGVIPVLTTFSSSPDFHWESSIVFNNIILDVADVYGTPVINLWAATQPMPNYGVHDDGYHNSDQGTFAITHNVGSDSYSAYYFNESLDMFGLTKRNLLTLQALDILRRNVLGG